MRDIKKSDVLNYALLSYLAYCTKHYLNENQGLIPDDWELEDTFSYITENKREKSAKSNMLLDSSSALIDSAADCLAKICNPHYLICHVFTNKRSNQVVFAFKGTEISDMSAIWANSQIAAGKGLELPEALKRFINHSCINYEGQELVFTGHSLGGFLARQIVLDNKIKARVVVFDAPGVNIATATLLKSSMVSLVNFVLKPNLINLHGNHLGDLVHLQCAQPYSEEGRYSIQRAKLTNEQGEEKILTTVLRQYLYPIIARPLVGMAIAEIRLLPKEKTLELLDRIVNGNILENTASALGINEQALLASLTATKDSHEIDAFINALHAIQDEHFEHSYKAIDTRKLPRYSALIESGNSVEFQYIQASTSPAKPHQTQTPNNQQNSIWQRAGAVKQQIIKKPIHLIAATVLAAAAYWRTDAPTALLLFVAIIGLLNLQNIQTSEAQRQRPALS